MDCSGLALAALNLPFFPCCSPSSFSPGGVRLSHVAAFPQASFGVCFHRFSPIGIRNHHRFLSHRVSCPFFCHFFSSLMFPERAAPIQPLPVALSPLCRSRFLGFRSRIPAFLPGTGLREICRIDRGLSLRLACPLFDFP